MKVEINMFVLQYYLVNDTLEIREVHNANDGRDPFPVLINRHKVRETLVLINPARVEVGVTTMDVSNASRLIRSHNYELHRYVDSR